MEMSLKLLNVQWIYILCIQIILKEIKAQEKIIKLGYLPAMNFKGPARKNAGAFIYALKHFNAETNILPGYKLEYMYNDNKGATLEAISGMTAQYLEGVDAFIGPDITCATAAQVAGAWNLPIIAYTCSELMPYNVSLFPTFARTLPSEANVAKSIISLMNNFSWTSFTIIVGNSSELMYAADTLKLYARTHQVTINDIVYFNENYELADSIKKMGEIVEKTKDKTRIYVFLGNDDTLIDFARSMYDNRLVDEGEHVVVAVRDGPYDPSINEAGYFLKFPAEKMGKLTSNHILAFRSVIQLMPRSPTNPMYELFENESRDYLVKEPAFKISRPPPGLTLPVDISAAHLYDAVSIYVRALHELLEEGGKPTNGKAIAEKIRSRTFKSIRGHDVFIDARGNAEANYSVIALKKDETSDYGWSLQPVANFTMTNNGFEIPVFNYDNGIEWVSGSVPVSEPQCGFDGSKCIETPTDWTAAALCGLGVAIVIVAAVFACRHYLYEQKLERLLWKIDAKELTVVDNAVEQVDTEKPKRKSSRFSFFMLEPTIEPTNRSESRISKQYFTKVASYKGNIVSVKHIRKKSLELNRALKKIFQIRKELTHDNINKFIGACIDPPNIVVVTHYCARGSLKDILENNDLHLDDMFISSLVSDLIKGMTYLHESEFISHGNLKSSNCLVDSRWVLQVSDFGLHHIRASDIAAANTMDEEKQYKKLLWTAPELMRETCPPDRGTQKADVYSFAIILHEIIARNGPWGKVNLSANEIIKRVRMVRNDEFRPDVSMLNKDDNIVKCMCDCWDENPELRPDFKYIRIRLKSIHKGLRSNIFDNMLAMMEKYANNLEALVDERTDQLIEEKRRTEALLLRMLPKSVADQLKKRKPVVPEQYECVTIYFSDIVGFTSMSAQSTPLQVIDILNDLYTTFDSIIENYDVYKVETIGDAYMVVSGCPTRNGNNHAGEIASMSIALLSAIKSFRIRHIKSETLKLRIGIHSGPVVAGVVGLKMPRYCLFGDTVNTASRMESSGVALKIHCSKETKEILDGLNGYHMDERGMVNIKGKGDMFTYFLTGEDKIVRERRISRESNMSNRVHDNVEVHNLDECAGKVVYFPKANRSRTNHLAERSGSGSSKCSATVSESSIPEADAAALDMIMNDSISDDSVSASEIDSLVNGDIYSNTNTKKSNYILV
ncbi:unnamed protein product [Owenia fusiformis]|uniref:Guanylate cyclase n=1 Tax=Owenia fusiformis TaxID=6347 RepID=A0A8S4PL86_OWEFU|nr:unnamed protein product [Owenia fusiformis]